VKDLQNLLLDLVSTLQILPASRLLPSSCGNRNLFGDLIRLGSVINSHDFDIERVIPLLKAILGYEPDKVIWDTLYAAVAESTPPPRPLLVQQTPLLHNTSSFVNSSQYRKYMDGVLKEELGFIYTGVPRFYERFFGDIAGLESTAGAIFNKCKAGDTPLYQEGRGWWGWPEDANEKDVLSWFALLTSKFTGFSDFSDLSKEHRQTSKTPRRPLALPNQPLEGPGADRKLDVGFVDDPNAGKNGSCHWSHILVPGELKSNPATDKASRTWLDLGRYVKEVFAVQDTRRFVLGFTLCGSFMRLWEFDRLGGIASAQFNINEDGLQFVRVILGFLWMNEEQLGFDPTILAANGKRYIEIKQNNQTERLIIDELIKRAPCIAGRATTCWKAHREGDEHALVIKDSWQFPEREEEGELLLDATKSEVINVARHYYHETVRVGGKFDDIQANVRKGLNITMAENYKPESLMPPSDVGGKRGKGRSSNSTASRKRSSSCIDAGLPPSKRPHSGSSAKGSMKGATLNRVHRRVIVRDYGKAIYKASSQAAMLAALRACIEGYESLHMRAGMLQRDISINNLMINEDSNNLSWQSFLIDLDLAIKEQRIQISGARGKTGTRAFMAIGVLLGEKHSFMHDLESFFWVLFWTCIHYDGPNKGKIVPQFEEWNYLNTEKLAKEKLGTVSDEDIFRNTATKYFTEYYQPLVPWVNRLRRVVFPGGGKWKKEDQNLYSAMKGILLAAQNDPGILVA
jgi:hypothetical protein